MQDKVTFEHANLQVLTERQVFIELSLEYFQWMDKEIMQLCGFSIPSIVNMSISDYVVFTTDIAAKINSYEGGVYFLKDSSGNVTTMGGIRRLTSTSAEIVRIYTRPQCRGYGYGRKMVSSLILEARRIGYENLFLDTGVFMKSAHKIYEEAGFLTCPPYPGAEPPEALVPYWLYMKRSL